MTSAMLPLSASTCSRSSLKRKRDDPGITVPSATAPFSLLPESGQARLSTREIATLGLKGESHFRTMKRVRNRPCEQDIHENTLQKLFNAQCLRSPPTPLSASPNPAPVVPKNPSRPSISNYFTSFFTSSKPLSSKPFIKQGVAPPPQPLAPLAPICEDCDRPLQEREIFSIEEVQCINCHRTVCSEGGCSITVNDGRGGDGRVCLGCALK